jgi:hypothetical protein
MPSKRHGYLTRKEWLAARLMIQRGKASYERFATTSKRMIDALTADVFDHIEARIAHHYFLHVEPDIEIDIE